MNEEHLRLQATPEQCPEESKVEAIKIIFEAEV
jgi:hypothetical protein